MVLEVVPRTMTTHSGVEGPQWTMPWQSSQDRRQSSGSVQHVVANCPTVENEGIFREPTITQLRSTAQWCWRCQGVRGVVNYHKVALEEERSFQQYVTLLGFKRILVRSDNERTLLSLIQRVMSNLTGVECCS